MRVEPLYVASRQVLLDALEDLAEHRNAVIVVGAQAVYLRTDVELSGVAEYTTDSDLALAFDQLADTPLLEAVMRGRFRHEGPIGAAAPGAWMRTVDIGGEDIDVPVDLMVPAGMAPPGGSRGARLPAHGNRAARKAPGLEAATLDNDWLTIEALDDEDQRAIEARVAGPTALLIAKAFKIHDRLEEVSGRSGYWRGNPGLLRSAVRAIVGECTHSPSVRSSGSAPRRRLLSPTQPTGRVHRCPAGLTEPPIPSLRAANMLDLESQAARLPDN